jgi:hypothetical protein
MHLNVMYQWVCTIHVHVGGTMYNSLCFEENIDFECGTCEYIHVYTGTSSSSSNFFFEQDPKYIYIYIHYIEYKHDAKLHAIS